MALAACITMIVLGTRLGKVDEASVASLSPSSSAAGKAAEDLMIARAWASNRLDATTSEAEIADAGVDDAVTLSSVDSPDTDATLSWMYVAVSASIDADESRAENDG